MEDKLSIHSFQVDEEECRIRKPPSEQICTPKSCDSWEAGYWSTVIKNKQFRSIFLSFFFCLFSFCILPFCSGVLLFVPVWSVFPRFVQFSYVLFHFASFCSVWLCFISCCSILFPFVSIYLFCFVPFHFVPFQFFHFFIFPSISLRLLLFLSVSFWLFPFLSVSYREHREQFNILTKRQILHSIFKLLFFSAAPAVGWACKKGGLCA